MGDLSRNRLSDGTMKIPIGLARALIAHYSTERTIYPEPFALTELRRLVAEATSESETKK